MPIHNKKTANVINSNFLKRKSFLVFMERTFRIPCARNNIIFFPKDTLAFFFTKKKISSKKLDELKRHKKEIGRFMNFISVFVRITVDKILNGKV